MITVDMVSAIKVQFIKPIFGDDFVEKGMMAWLTDIEWDEKADCYNLYFDLSDFEEYNDKYFKECYYENSATRLINTRRSMFTAKEAGFYKPKYSVYFSVKSGVRNDPAFAVEIQPYLREVGKDNSYDGT